MAMAHSDPYAAHGRSTAPIPGEQIDFAAIAPDVAQRLFGEPNKRLSSASVLRFGTHGSMAVNVGDGTFYDHEGKVGGGTLWAIQQKQGCDAAQALSWLEAEGFKDRTERDGSRRPAQILSIFYEYCDETGTILSKVKRSPDKRFIQLGPDGNGGFHAMRGCMDGVRRVPYRLPELLAADPDRAVFIVEGEKDADRLASLGLVASCNSQGAGKFGADLTPHFADRKVVILPDNDPAGRDHAQDVAAKLADVAAVVTILDLPDLPAKGDVSDWLDAGGTADRLKELAGAALDNPTAQIAGPETFPIADLTMWSVAEPTPKAFLMPGFLPARELTLLTGEGGANKSTFGQQLATCVAGAVPMLGVDVAEGAALYITAEDDDDRLHWMQAHICRALGVDMVSLAGQLHLSSLRGRLGNELATFDAEGKLRPSPAFATLKSTIAATAARFVVLDNCAHLFAGNENDRGQVTAFVNLLYSLCVDLNVTIALVAHTNKAGDDYSGSTAWLNAVRSQVRLSRPDENDPDARVMRLGKANYARQGEELRFRWHDFALILEGDLPADQREALAQTIATTSANGAFLDCLRKRSEQGEGRMVGPAPGPNYAPAQFEGMPEARGLKRGALKQAMERLFAIGAIESYTYRNVSKGRDVTVLREIGEAPRTPSRTAPEHSSRSTPNPVPNHPAHTPYTTYSSGAASGARAPDRYVNGNPALGPVRDDDDPAVAAFDRGEGFGA